jgi:hypothetical protein
MTKRKPQNRDLSSQTRDTKPTATTPGAQAILAARKVAAKELGLKLDDWRVRQMAVLMVAHDDVEVHVATDGAVDHVEHLLKLTDAMAKLRDAVPKQPLKVQFAFVEGCVGIYFCKHCGQQNDLKPNTYTPADSRPALTSDALKPAAVLSTEGDKPENIAQGGPHSGAHETRTSDHGNSRS